MASVHFITGEKPGLAPVATRSPGGIIIDFQYDTVHIHGSDEDLRALAAAIAKAVGE